MHARNPIFSTLHITHKTEEKKFFSTFVKLFYHYSIIPIRDFFSSQKKNCSQQHHNMHERLLTVKPSQNKETRWNKFTFFNKKMERDMHRSTSCAIDILIDTNNKL